MQGEGTFTLSEEGGATPVAVVPQAPPPKRNALFRLLESFWRWLLGRAGGGAPQRDANAALPAPPGSTTTCLRFALQLEPGGPMAPMIDAMIRPLMLPAAEDLANRILAQLESERRGVSGFSFVASEQALLDAASKATGLDDFGDGAWRDHFRALLRAYDEESQLTEAGRQMVQGEIGGALAARLACEAAWKRDPGVLRHEIRRPIFILGLPRSGTTALHWLLAQDPANQVLEYWIAAAPRPRPPRATWDAEPAFQGAVEVLKWIYDTDPGLRAIHVMEADGPEECRHLFVQSFLDHTFDSNATIPGYTKYFEAQDMRPAYERHRDVLRLVGSTSPEQRWVLKYPAHMRELHTLLAVYPDACIVQTHRDPVQVLPSICSLVTGWRSLYEGRADAKAIGAWQLEMYASMMEHAMDVRAKAEPCALLRLRLPRADRGSRRRDRAHVRALRNRAEHRGRAPHAGVARGQPPAQARRTRLHAGTVRPRRRRDPRALRALHAPLRRRGGSGWRRLAPIRKAIVGPVPGRRRGMGCGEWLAPSACLLGLRTSVRCSTRPCAPGLLRFTSPPPIPRRLLPFVRRPDRFRFRPPRSAGSRPASVRRLSSLVAQPETLMRMPAAPRHVVGPAQQTPSRCTRSITRAVRAASPNDTTTWFSTTSLRTS